MSVEEISFGKMSDGREISVFVITNKNGLRAKFGQIGAAIVSIEVPDKNGEIADVVLGYDDAAGYETDTNYIGMVIGRVSSRIGKAHFELDGETFHLEANENGVTHLHGGSQGFHRKVWGAEIVGENSVRMKLFSADGESGYPGDLAVEVLYTWSDENALEIEYSATALTCSTVCDLTNHSYFNLAGSGSTQSQFLQVFADRHLLVDEEFIPTGEFADVDGVICDFREEKRIVDLTNGGWHGAQLAVNRAEKDDVILVAKARDEKSWRTVECFSNQNSLVFYDGKFLGGIGKNGVKNVAFGGFCLETQNFTNAVNRPQFPTSRLNVGEKYRHICIYKFGVENS